MTTPKSKTTETLPDGLVFLTVQSNGTVKRTEQPIDFDYKADPNLAGDNLAFIALARRNGVYTLRDLAINKKAIDPATMTEATQEMLRDEGLGHPEDAVVGDPEVMKVKWEAALRAFRGPYGQTITDNGAVSLENLVHAVKAFIGDEAEAGFAEFAYAQYEREVAANDTAGGQFTPGGAAVLAFVLTVTHAMIPEGKISEAVDRVVIKAGVSGQDAAKVRSGLEGLLGRGFHGSDGPSVF